MNSSTISLTQIATKLSWLVLRSMFLENQPTTLWTFPSLEHCQPRIEQWLIRFWIGCIGTAGPYTTATHF